MIKVLHLITDLNVGGAETSLYRLLSAMDRRRFSQRIVSLIPAGVMGERIHQLGLEVDSLEMKPGRISLSGLRRFIGLLRRDPPDLVQTWMYHADLLGLVGTRLAGGYPLVWNIRSSFQDPRQHHRLSRLVISACARLSACPQAVVVNSRAGQISHAGLGYHPRRWVQIPNGIQADQFHPDTAARQDVRRELGLETEARLIGMFARYHPVKDFPLFLRAAGRLAAERKDVYFVLAGLDVDPANRELAELIDSEHLEGRVHLLGLREDIARLEAAMDVVAMTSMAEGFPNVVAEAMACGVPCAVTETGDAPDLVGETGRVVPRGDARGMACAWGELLSLDGPTRLRMSDQARQRILDCFSLDATVTAYQDLYASLVDPGKHGVKK